MKRNYTNSAAIGVLISGIHMENKDRAIAAAIILLVGIVAEYISKKEKK